MHIPIITSIITYYKLFYGYAGRSLYVLILLILLGGMFEGFGIMMLLPLLNFGQSEDVHDSYSHAMYQFLESSGIGISLFSIISFLLIAFSLKGVFLFLQGVMSVYITTNLEKKLKIGFCEKFRAMKYSYYTNVSIGYLNNLVTTETDRAIAGLNKFTTVIASIIFISVYISASFIINWVLSIIALIVCFFLFVMFKQLSQITRKLSVLISEKFAQIQSLLIQTIYNFKYLKSTESFKNVFKQLFKKIDDQRHYKFKSGVLLAIPKSIIEPASVIFLSVIVLYYVDYKGKTIAEIMVLLLFFYKTFTRVFSFQTDWQSFNANTGSIMVVEKAFKALDNNREATGDCFVKGFKRSIELKRLNFSYGSKQVLFDIDMVIPKNRAIGIIGESGAGKTTLFDILTGLFTPMSGSISIDGIDYKDLEMASLRKIMGYITQEPVIFNDTIANNISFWKLDGDNKAFKAKLESSAFMAHSTDFINKAENGYNTIIGDKGVKLSGGQRQRIAIARELFKEPEIMIFDEATSALDTESEQLIQRSINSLKGERTVMIIAHRLSTVRDCDVIYVLKDGRIVEEGSFDELYKDTSSRFYSMCQKQNM